MIAPIEHPMTTGKYGEGNTTHFTPRPMAEEIARYTLDPLIYSPGRADGADIAHWRRRPAHELLRIPTSDPACGSGAMLLAVVRYLAAHVHLAMDDQLRQRPPELGVRDEDETPLISAEAAMRQTVRSIYGNDINPFSVETTRLVLSMAAHAPGLPLIPMETNIVWGDSLVGAVSSEELTQLQGVHLQPAEDVERALGEAAYLRGVAMRIPIVDISDVRECRILFAWAAERIRHIQVRADLAYGAYLREHDLPKKKRKAWPHLRQAAHMMATATEEAVAAQATQWLTRDNGNGLIRPLHYVVAYPEKFATPVHMDALPEFEPAPIPDEVGQAVQEDLAPLAKYLDTAVQEQIRALYPMGAPARAALLGDDGPRCGPTSTRPAAPCQCRGLLDILATHSGAIAVGPPAKATKTLVRKLAADRGLAAHALAMTLAIAALDAPGGASFAGRRWVATTQLPTLPGPAHLITTPSTTNATGGTE